MGAKAEDGPPSTWKNPLPALFIGVTMLQMVFGYEWPKRWLISGAPALTFVLLLGETNGTRVLPFAHIWSLFTTVNLAYAVASTSWLLYWVFTILCYPTVFFTCLFQFGIVGAFTRRIMRAFLKQLHFINDKIALFDIPALEIDTEVDGLMIVRGVTVSLSSLSVMVHDIEVGIKLSDDLELVIRTDHVTVSLLRSIQVGDCFANIKGGKHEMTSGHIARKSKDADGDALLTTDASSSPQLVKMRDEMTDGKPPQTASPGDGVKGMKPQILRHGSADEIYRQVLESIDRKSAIHQSRKHFEKLNDWNRSPTQAGNATEEHALRAAICSHLHAKTPITHPSKRSIKVTTLQNLSPPWAKRFMHRLPMLLRLLLCLTSYFHPVKVSSITATASGRWIQTMLSQKIFKEYSDSDSELLNFKERISAWVSEANFAVGLGRMTGLAQVPFMSSDDINCRLAFEDVMAYRTLPEKETSTRIVKLGGADGDVIVPTFLLPHHEHLLPAAPTQGTKSEAKLDDSDGKPSTSQLQSHPKQAKKDEAAVKLAVHARLPAVFDQELLDFLAILVKAAKLVEIDKKPGLRENGAQNLSDFTDALNQKMKNGMTKAVIANDQWLARLVGKVMGKLERASGDFGYRGDIPVDLTKYRVTGWLETEGEKLLL